jgi:hypothetical protein
VCQSFRWRHLLVNANRKRKPRPLFGRIRSTMLALLVDSPATAAALQQRASR